MWVDARLARGRTRRTWRRPAPGPPWVRSESASRGPRFARRSSSWPAGARAPLPPAPAEPDEESARTRGQPPGPFVKRDDKTVRNSTADAQSKAKIARDFSRAPSYRRRSSRALFLFERRFEALTGGSKPRLDRDFRDRPEFAGATRSRVTLSFCAMPRVRKSKSKSEPRRATRSLFVVARRHAAFRARRARHVSSLGGARARATTAMADARATMERLARLAKAQVRFDPARRPRESGHPPLHSTCSRQLCSYPRPDALPPSRA